MSGGISFLIFFAWGELLFGLQDGGFIWGVYRIGKQRVSFLQDWMVSAVFFCIFFVGSALPPLVDCPLLLTPRYFPDALQDAEDLEKSLATSRSRVSGGLSDPGEVTPRPLPPPLGCMQFNIVGFFTIFYLLPPFFLVGNGG